ncbi:response regulator [Cohnella silvisoli]|uniref:histidine kinase n=1 Tax=Cohnella silvisoli TaxID=2873699 RepID=A0ABV1KLZ9_9BACL|nr:response regulator [Cohnella silvisoli]MCD9020822.1 response regulator [Cohnella silvisoli]
MKAKIGIIVIIFIIFFGIRFYRVYEGDRNAPQAKAGILDLSKWDAREGGVIPLQGQWAFYPGMLLEPKPGQLLSSIEKAQFLKVPGAWDRAISPDKPTPFGYGTYKLEIIMPRQKDLEYAVNAQIIRTAHRMYIDGKLVGQEGEPGTDSASTKPRVMPYTAKFSANGDKVELVIATANFDYGSFGGIFHNIRFGSSEAIDRSYKLGFIGNNLLMGFYIISGVYFLFLFFFRRSNKELLYFSLFFWMSLLFWATHEDRLLFWLFPQIDYEWQTKLQMLPSIGVYLSLFMFVLSMFPGIGRRRTVKFIGILTAADVCFVLFTKVYVFSQFELIMMGVYGVLFSYSFYILLISGLKREDGSTYSLIAAMCILMESLDQAINYLGLAPETGVLPYKRILFVLTMAMFIAKRFFNNMEQVEIISKRLLVADRLKNDFLANTSQEIRLPLHGIVNLAQIMIDEGGLKDERQEERLALMVATGRRLAHSLNDIMDLSKLNDGGFELQLRAVDVRMTINGVLEVMRYMTGNATTRFENRTESGLPYVKADEQRLMQILFNLLHYAAKSGAEGIIAVKAEWAEGQDEVSVTISAPGSANKQGEQISESGLNLEISRKLIEMHGGFLNTNPSFSPSLIELRFSLPIFEEQLKLSDSLAWGTDESDEAQSEVAAAGAQSSLPADAPKVLIVDDDPTTLKIMADILGQEGLRVTAVSDGLQGLKAWERESDWDLVVLDVMLPRLSGYELCRHIRERKSFYELPVLFLTSRNQPADLLVGFNAGANDYVTQPIDVSEFRARTRTLLRMKQSIRDQLHMEMALIQAQIKPHFLFNTLNTIASLSEIDPERTRVLLNDFGRYLRSSFDMRNLDKRVPFTKEWMLVQSYLQIEQARFGDRMRLSVLIPEHILFHLPPLSIQPIVENALRHGILPRFEGGHLHIEVAAEPDGYLIKVRDDGVGFAPGRLEAVMSGDYRAGIGLMNVHRRLINAHGSGLKIVSEAGLGTEVSFRIPIMKEESA